MVSLVNKLNINHNIYEYTGKVPENTFYQYCTGELSEGGEEGIIDRLLSDLEVKEGWFCDFGAHNGISNSNTYSLVQRGWKGVAIEGDTGKYNQLCTNYMGYPNVICKNSYVQASGELSLDNILGKTSIPRYFDVLSIDIDHDDYHVWKELKNYRPKIVVIEYNPYRDPVCEQLPGDKEFKPSQNKDILVHVNPERMGNGTSFRAMIKLGLSKGYIPVACTGNLIFVRRDLVDRVSFPHVVTNNTKAYLYLYPRFFRSAGKWVTNNLLRYNCIVRDQYLKTGVYDIDLASINFADV